MVGLREVEQLVELARGSRVRVIFRFRGVRYMIMIDGEVKAIDQDGAKVPWGKAFQRPPHIVLSSYSLSRIEVLCGDREVAVYSSLAELLKGLQGIKC